jgi:hypothetical protein
MQPSTDHATILQIYGVPPERDKPAPLFTVDDRVELLGCMDWPRVSRVVQVRRLVPILDGWALIEIRSEARGQLQTAARLVSNLCATPRVCVGDLGA